MNVERTEAWGTLRYDTLKHRFSRVENNPKDAVPYIQHPVVLNIDLTMKCNIDCSHCVTKDFGLSEDLIVSKKLIDWINKSPFMVIVITGGEPLLPEYENNLITLLEGIQDRGLIIDTNGTNLPSSSVIRAILDTNALVRISWDSIRPRDETYFRHLKPDDTKQNKEINLKYYNKKVDMIHHLLESGISVSIQSVVQKKNLASIVEMPAKLKELSINQWYIQRFIPSHKAKNFQITNSEYDQVISKLTKKCEDLKIECITKKDRRHNCVVLLIGKGLIFTQGEKPGQKILLGTIDSEISYFDYISCADHAERYYG